MVFDVQNREEVLKGGPCGVLCHPSISLSRNGSPVRSASVKFIALHVKPQTCMSTGFEQEWLQATAAII